MKEERPIEWWFWRNDRSLWMTMKPVNDNSNDETNESEMIQWWQWNNYTM